MFSFILLQVIKYAKTFNSLQKIQIFSVIYGKNSLVLIPNRIMKYLEISLSFSKNLGLFQNGFLVIPFKGLILS